MTETKDLTVNEGEFRPRATAISKKAMCSLSLNRIMNEKENSFKLLKNRVELRLVKKVVENESFFRYYGAEITANDTLVVLVGNNPEFFNGIRIGETFSVSAATVYPKSRLLVLGRYAQVCKMDSDIPITFESCPENRDYFGEYPFCSQMVDLKKGQLMNVEGRIEMVNSSVNFGIQNWHNMQMLPFSLRMDNGLSSKMLAWNDLADCPWIQTGNAVRLYACTIQEYHDDIYFKLQADTVIELVQPVETDIGQNLGCCMAVLEWIRKFFRCCKK